MDIWVGIVTFTGSADDGAVSLSFSDIIRFIFDCLLYSNLGISALLYIFVGLITFLLCIDCCVIIG